MAGRVIRVLTFEGCPHADAARTAAREAIERSGLDIELHEVELGTPQTPEEFSAYPSPTVLVGVSDASGRTEVLGGMGCRASGAPTVAQIHDAIASAWASNT